MKSRLFVFIVLCICTHTVIGQTENQKLKAEAYHQDQQFVNRYTNSWYWLFGSSNSKSNNDEPPTVNWELEDGGWYTGQGRNNEYSGFGIQYKPKDNAYIFSKWENTSPDGMTLSQSLDYSFLGTYENNEKNGFGITKWSNYKPFSNENYKNVIKFIGEYKDGVWHGYGIIYFRNGTYKSGIFINSILSKELPKIEVLEALGF
tara:strand:+ start:969 stop:1577 length:609 start_codon:yes stop_codon:yes gene_type:complete